MPNMNLLVLTPEEKAKLKRIVGDKQLMSGLEKILLSGLLGKPSTDNVQILAAQRLALEGIRQAFTELKALSSLDEEEDRTVNPAV